MKYLLESQISSYLRPEKSIEQYIGKTEQTDHSTLKWVAIERTKDTYILVIHEVFDERNEVNSIYECSYFEPDDMYGKRISVFENLNNALEMAKKDFGANVDKYLPFGFLDEYLEQQNE